MQYVLKSMTIRVMVLLCLSAEAFSAAGCGAPVYESIADGPASSAAQSGASGRIEDTSFSSGTSSDKEAGSLFVYVCGAVRHAGVYELKEGARVYEALEAAGGLTDGAEETSLNQAAFLTDGQQITVLTKEEALQGHDSLQPSASGAVNDGKININTADASELMTLKGIGQSRAEDIIKYRTENGPFGAIEEIMQVSGIKTAVFEKIRDDITVGQSQ